MKDIYLIYVMLPSEVYNSRIKYLMDSRYTTFRYKDGFVTGLYAWSNSKSLVKKFLATRADIFTVKKKDMSDSSYKKYKKEYSDLRLGERRYYTDVSFRVAGRYMEDDDDKDSDEHVDVVTTKFEYVAATIEISENMMSFGPASYLNEDYKIFNQRIIEALDVLQYTVLYDTYVPTTPESDEMIERENVANYNAGFSLTPYSNRIFKFDEDEYVVLLYLFSYIFFGVY